MILQPSEKAATIARYEQIALDLAKRIANGEYKEGAKLFGRSTLAGTYQVSPETIRRAIALLHSRGILTAEAGKGITIDSAAQAARFVEEASAKNQLEEIMERLDFLTSERNRINAEIERLLQELFVHYRTLASTWHFITEMVIPEGSPLAGQTLTTAQIRARTGATVMAVSKRGEDIFSPPPDLRLEPGDVLVTVGTADAKEKLKAILETDQ